MFDLRWIAAALMCGVVVGLMSGYCKDACGLDVGWLLGYVGLCWKYVALALAVNGMFVGLLQYDAGCMLALCGLIWAVQAPVGVMLAFLLGWHWFSVKCNLDVWACCTDVCWMHVCVLALCCLYVCRIMVDRCVFMLAVCAIAVGLLSVCCWMYAIYMFYVWWIVVRVLFNLYGRTLCLISGGWLLDVCVIAVWPDVGFVLMADGCWVGLLSAVCWMYVCVSVV